MSKEDYKFTNGTDGLDLLHTPDGVRDIYGTECENKLALQNRMHDVLKTYGFRDIQTPSFEFFDIFSKEKGTVSSQEMYKFFDRDNNTLVLRPDMTPSIARCIAKYQREEELQVRLCYMGNTYVNNMSYQGKLKETTQVGAELINDDSSDADAEMIVLAVQCMLESGLKEFQISVGHALFFEGFLDAVGCKGAEKSRLRAFMQSKNFFGVQETLADRGLSTDVEKMLERLPEMFGSIENIQFVKAITDNEKILKAIDRLEKVHAILVTYGLEQYVTYDLTEVSKYTYYTGIIFRGYTYGNGDAIVTGGRYDSLIGRYGKEAPAIGIAVVVDNLMTALMRQKLFAEPEEDITLLVFEPDSRHGAIERAEQLRHEGKKVQLMRKSSRREFSQYEEYAKRTPGIGAIQYFEGR